MGISKTLWDQTGGCASSTSLLSSAQGPGIVVGYEPDDDGKQNFFNETQTIPMTKVEKILVGESHFCARNNQNKLNCWGMNKSGQLGIGNSNSYFEPQLVNLEVADFALSNDARCAVYLDGEV